MNKVRWTWKAPALIAGVALAALGLVTTTRGRIIAGLAIIILGAAFVAYSMTIKDFCAVHQHGWHGGTWGQTGFGGQLGECLAEKGWFSF